MPTEERLARPVVLETLGAWALLLLLCSGCFTTRYLTQAAGGQLSIILHARPLSSLIKDPRAPPHVRMLLKRVPEIRAFGELHGLEPTQNYARYTDLKRTAAVWVVQACAPLKFEPKRWSMPIVGSVPYLGFFDEAEAHAYAKQLAEREHLDVDVAGVSAYSTLGWFRDPILSTMIPEEADALAGLVNTVLHESVHATLYIPGQSAFDESLASFVADALTAAYLARRQGPTEVAKYLERQERKAVRLGRLHDAYGRLDALYSSPLSEEDKRVQKAALFEHLQRELGTARTFNNAVLSGHRNYDAGRPAFQRLLSRCKGDFKRFMATVRKLEASSFPKPQMDNFTPVVDRLTHSTPGPCEAGASGRTDEDPVRQE